MDKPKYFNKRIPGGMYEYDEWKEVGRELFTNHEEEEAPPLDFTEDN